MMTARAQDFRHRIIAVAGGGSIIAASSITSFRSQQWGGRMRRPKKAAPRFAQV
jgi:hypothetical protein